MQQTREYHKKNWETNKDPKSLHMLADMIRKGIDGYQNAKEARELYKKNWEENQYPDSLHELAYMTEYGIGGVRDTLEAYNLYFENWEKNKHEKSRELLRELGYRDFEENKYFPLYTQEIKLTKEKDSSCCIL